MQYAYQPLPIGFVLHSRMCQSNAFLFLSPNYRQHYFFLQAQAALGQPNQQDPLNQQRCGGSNVVFCSLYHNSQLLQKIIKQFRPTQPGQVQCLKQSVCLTQQLVVTQPSKVRHCLTFLLGQSHAQAKVSNITLALPIFVSNANNVILLLTQAWPQFVVFRLLK